MGKMSVKRIGRGQKAFRTAEEVSRRKLGEGGEDDSTAQGHLSKNRISEYARWSQVLNGLVERVEEDHLTRRAAIG